MTEGEGPTIDLSSPILSLCENSTINLNDFVSANGTLSFFDATTNQELQDASAATTGSYYVIAIDDTNQCSSEQVAIQVEASADQPAAIIATPETITCVNQEIQIDASASTNGADISYQWQTGTGVIVAGENTTTPILSAGGMYTLVVTNETNGCSVESSIEVQEDNLAPSVSINPPTSRDCALETIEIDVNGTSTGSNFEYSWTTDIGEFISETNVLSPTIATWGTYQLEVVNTDNGCTAQSSLFIDDWQTTEVDLLVQQPECSDDKGIIQINQVQGGIAPYRYSIDGGSSFTDQTIFRDLEADNYEVVIVDAANCRNEESIEISQTIAVNIQVDNSFTIEKGDSTRIEALTTLSAEEVASFNIEWSPSEGLSCTDCLDPIAKPIRSTIYTLTVSNREGCESTSQVRVLVDETTNIYAPNAFKPNGSVNGNDRFTLYAKGGKVREIKVLEVYNRWGALVFQQKNFPANDPSMGWDGSFNNEVFATSEVFIYRAEVEMFDGNIVKFSGDFTLME